MNTIGFAITPKFPITDKFFTLDANNAAESILPECKQKLKATLQNYITNIDNSAKNIRFHIPHFSINDFDPKTKTIGTMAGCATDVFWDTENENLPHIDTHRIENCLTETFGTKITTNTHDFIPAEKIDASQFYIFDILDMESA